jgi:hypothetical protein
MREREVFFHASPGGLMDLWPVNPTYQPSRWWDARRARGVQEIGLNHDASGAPAPQIP